MEDYQRAPIEWNQAVSVGAIKEKTFKETAEIYGTSSSTVILRFDRIAQTEIKAVEELPKVIAIDEFMPFNFILSFVALVIDLSG